MAKKYVAVYGSGSVRDAQICKIDQETVEEFWDDQYWEDIEGAELFIGIFTGTEAEVIAQVTAQENCVESAIKLIPID